MDAIDHLLSRGVDTILPSKEALEKVLRSDQKLRLYQGFDPTGARLHIGHSVAMRKLRKFQELGHKVIFLIGDFTATIGDPSGKADARPILTHEQVLENAKEYQRQASKILKFDGDNPVEVLFNNEWLSKLSFADVIRLASHFTVQQMIERDMFQARIKRSDQIGLHEFLYPLMVGYDSVAMNIDLELGGTDQMFNMIAGRKLVSQIQHREKFVMTVPLLTDSKGTKIGKTEGNVIGLADEPTDFYGKIMSLGDDAIIPCFTLLTDTPMDAIDTMKKKIKAGDNPMVWKKRLAFELTKSFNSEMDAERAQCSFEQAFSHTTQQTVSAKAAIAKPVVLISNATIYEALGAAPYNKSKSEVKRLITSGSIDINNSTLLRENDGTLLNNNDIINIGPHTILKVIKK